MLPLIACSVMGGYDACLKRAAIGTKTYFKLFKHSTEPAAANSTTAILR